MNIEFLTIEDVLYIHQNQIDQYGGEYGVREAGLLDSAVAQPQAMFGGTYLHRDLFTMAAAYLYHLVQNHPFIDGNKRTGAVAALVFLDWNGIEILADNDGLAEITLQVATSKAEKDAVAQFFQAHVAKP